MDLLRLPVCDLRLELISKYQTARKVLNEADYQFFHSRKMGLLTNQDLKSKVEFCRRLDIENLTKRFGW